MIVTFEDRGVSKISDYEDTRSRDDIQRLLHTASVREQYVEYFRGLIGKSTPHSTIDTSDINIGWALELVSKKKFFSEIKRIEFHPGKSLRNFGVK